MNFEDRPMAVCKQLTTNFEVEPGERIIVEVTDFDLDRTSAADKVPVSVQVNLGQPLGLEAVETGPNRCVSG